MRLKKFTVHDQQGNPFTEKDLKKEKTLLYFYPKDMTSGCTVEANDFQKKLKLFQKKKVRVIGVSKDSEKSHLKFCEKEGLSFLLLSDVDGVLCDMFDVIKEKSMYGKKYLGIERSSFLLDQGKLVQEWRKVKVAGHVDEILEVL